MKSRGTVVRRRADGIPQIARVRCRLSVEPYGGSLALVFIAVALYIGTFGPAAVVVLLTAACMALDSCRRRRHPAGPARGAAGDVVRLTASRR